MNLWTLCYWYLSPINYLPCGYFGWIFELYVIDIWDQFINLPCEYFGWIFELYVIDIWDQFITYNVNILDESLNSMW
jgi:hypothetical protein